MAALETFNDHRGRLFGIAYRMLGSVMEAEDMVQESYLRWQSSDDAIDNPKSFLTTIVTRLCIDQLRSARERRETYIGPWLPEPLLSKGGDGDDPADMLALADSLSFAFLVMLERLTPIERAVFLLREVFDTDYATIASTVDRSEANCRQIVHRARQRIGADRPRFDATAEEQQRIAGQFMQTCLTGDMQGLLALLDEQITAWSDGGGQVTAARRPVRGADNVARLMLGLLRRAPPGFSAEPQLINGQPGIVGRVDGEVMTVMLLHIEAGKVGAIYSVLNPDKLRYINRPAPSA